MSLFTESLNLSDEDADRLEQSVRNPNVARDAQYFDNVKKLWFRRFFYDGDGMGEYRPFLEGVLDEHNTEYKPRSAWVLNAFIAEARRCHLLPNVLFNKMAWMISCALRADGGVRGRTSKMVANFQRCVRNLDFDPDHYADPYFKELLSDDVAFGDFESAVLAMADGDNDHVPRHVAELRKAFKRSAQVVACDVEWKLYRNGNRTTVVLALENWLFPEEFVHKQTPMVVLSAHDRRIAKPKTGEGIFFALSEILEKLGNADNLKIQVEYDRNRHDVAIGQPDKVTEISGRLQSGDRPLVFQDFGDSSVHWHPLHSGEGPISSRYAWICLRGTQTIPLSDECRGIQGESGVMAYHVGPLDAENEEEYRVDGVPLFKYRTIGRQYIERSGFTDEIRIEDDQWRAFLSASCSLKSPRSNEWQRMVSAGQRAGVEIEGACCTISPSNKDSFEEFEIVKSRGKEYILYFPPSVLEDIRGGKCEGADWSFLPADLGNPCSLIERAANEGVTGTIKYRLPSGGERERKIFVKLASSEPVFWIERGACGYQDMDPSDCRLDGRDFGSWREIEGLYLCSKAPTSSADGVLSLSAILHDGEKQEIKVISNEGISDNYGRVSLPSLLKDISREFVENAQEKFYSGNRLLFTIGCRPDSIWLFKNADDAWSLFVPEERKAGEKLALFSEKALYDFGDMRVVDPDGLQPGPVGVKGLFGEKKESWRDVPVYAAIVDANLGDNPTLLALDRHIRFCTCVRDAEAAGVPELAERDYQMANFFLEKLGDVWLADCFHVTRERIRQKKVNEQIQGSGGGFDAIWMKFAREKRFAGENGTGISIQDVLGYMLDHGFNFLAAKSAEGGVTWLDGAYGAAAGQIRRRNGIPRYDERFIDNAESDKNNFQKGDGWLSAAAFHAFRLRYIQDPVWEQSGIREATRAYSAFWNGLNGQYLGNCLRNGGELRDDLRNRLLRLFGKDACDLANLVYADGDMEFLKDLTLRIASADIDSTAKRRTARLIGALDLNEPSGNGTADEKDKLDFEYAIIAMLAIVCRCLAIGVATLAPEKLSMVCRLVKKAFDAKCNGDDWYWRWLMRDIVAVDLIIRPDL